MQRNIKPEMEDLPLAEVDNLIASAEARIEQYRQHVRFVSTDFDASMKAIACLEAMTAALDKLYLYRQRIASEAEKPKH